MCAALLPVIALTARLIAIGETDPFGSLAGGTATLHGTIAEDQYKLDVVLRRRPEVLALGSSRVLQFRAEDFSRCDGRSDCFYNAGGEMRSIRSGLDFYARTSDQRAPRLLLLGIDLWHLDPNFDPRNEGVSLDVRQDPLKRAGLALGAVRTVTPLLQDAAVRNLILGRTPAKVGYEGITAILRHSGYRPDGSYDWGLGPDTGPETPRLGTLEGSRYYEGAHLDDLRHGVGRFPAFSHIDQAALADLDRLLTLAESRGTRVIGFTPVFSDAVAQAIDAKADLRAGADDVDRALSALFATHGAPLFLARSLSAAGCAPDEYWDGIHPTEVCDARRLATMAADPVAGPLLSPYVDPGVLRALVATRRDAFDLGVVR